MNNIEILEEYLDKQDRKFVSEHRLMILEAIENLIQENKELKEEQLRKAGIYKIGIDFDSDYIPKSKVKEKMQKDIKINEHVILGGRRNGKTLEYGKRLGRIEMCEELLEEGE